VVQFFPTIIATTILLMNQQLQSEETSLLQANLKVRTTFKNEILRSAQNDR